MLRQKMTSYRFLSMYQKCKPNSEPPLIPKDKPFDFSKELFPLMMELDLPLYGHIAEGYWCDIGNLEEYRRANADLLYGKVNLSEPIGTHIGGGIWAEDSVEIAPNAQLFGPIYLGKEVKIKGDVALHGPCAVRDYTIIDNYSRIERSIIWRNGYIGEACELRGAIISRQCSIKSKVIAFEGAVIGDSCVLGEGSTIDADVKIWPRKVVDVGSIVKDSIIWGTQGRRTLFNRFGISGVVNVDLTPEFAVKLGAALGATLERNRYVAINRDAHRSSRMLKRALISGMPGTGINVWDTEMVPIPVLRHFIRSQPNTAAGIHVRISPFDQRVVDMRFIDENGLNLKQATEREIERTFFREDFRRAYLDEIGVIDYVSNQIEGYTRDFLQYVNSERIRQSNFKIVVDYSHGVAAEALSDILSYLDVDVVPLNARTDESYLAVLEEKFKGNLEQVSKIVTALGADAGIQLDVGGEKMFLVDEQGTMLNDITTAALMTELALHANPGRAIAIPLMLPSCFQMIADWHGSPLINIANSIHSLMQAKPETEGFLLAVDGRGSFVFPEFLMAVDGMMASVCLLDYLSAREMKLSEVVAYLPPVFMARQRIDCPWEARARVMRLLNEIQDAQWIEKIDGIKIHLNDHEWIYLAPHPEQPFFDAFAEADHNERAEQIILHYAERIQSFIDGS
ncbi:nucleotidyl transferase [Chloroflexi bacterium TSY]|nr:nucleotidyl transferase [Chloroflexi bacterium TSY]